MHQVFIDQRLAGPGEGTLWCCECSLFYWPFRDLPVFWLKVFFFFHCLVEAVATCMLGTELHPELEFSKLFLSDGNRSCCHFDLCVVICQPY